MLIAQPPENFPIRVYYSESEYKWYWQYEYKGEFWEGFGFDSEKEALEYGIKYVKSQLLAHKRQAQQKMEEASSCLEQLEQQVGRL
jgi:hypothetical protein